MNENTSVKSNPLAMNVSASIQIQVHSQYKTQHSVSRALGILHSIVLIHIGYKKYTFMITFGVCRTQAGGSPLIYQYYGFAVDFAIVHC